MVSQDRTAVTSDMLLHNESYIETVKLEPYEISSKYPGMQFVCLANIPQLQLQSLLVLNSPQSRHTELYALVMKFPAFFTAI